MRILFELGFLIGVFYVDVGGVMYLILVGVLVGVIVGLGVLIGVLIGIWFFFIGVRGFWM